MNALIPIAMLFVFSVAGYGQVRDFSIRVSLEDHTVDRNSKEKIVTVTIRNNAADDLKAEGLGRIEFQFANCPPDIGDSLYCNGLRSKMVGSAEIPKKNLTQDEEFVFRVNLPHLRWETPRSTATFKANHAVPTFAQIREEATHFTAKIRLLKGYRAVRRANSDGSGYSKGNVPVYKVIYSNVIDIVFL